MITKPYNKETIDAIASIQEIMSKHNLAVVTNYSAHLSDDLLCDPIIWTIDDLEDQGATPEQWDNTRGYKIMHEASVEHGWEIMQCIIQDMEN